MRRAIVFFATVLAVITLSASSYAGQWQPPKTRAQLQHAVYVANTQENKMAALEQQFACAIVAGKHDRALAVARKRDAVLKRYMDSYVGRFRQFTNSLTAFMGGIDIGRRYPIIDGNGLISRFVAHPSRKNPCRIAIRVSTTQPPLKTAGR